MDRTIWADCLFPWRSFIRISSHCLQYVARPWWITHMTKSLSSRNPSVSFILVTGLRVASDYFLTFTTLEETIHPPPTASSPPPLETYSFTPVINFATAIHFSGLVCLLRALGKEPCKGTNFCILSLVLLHSDHYGKSTLARAYYQGKHVGCWVCRHYDYW